MNICFVTYGHVSKTRGGIDRVTDTLANSLMRRGHNIYMVSLCKPHEDDVLASYQFVLPQTILYGSRANEEYLSSFLVDNKIDIIVNQSEKEGILQLIAEVKGKVPLVSVFHTDPLFALKEVKDYWDYWRLYEKRWKFLSLFPYYVLRTLLRYRLRRNGVKGHYKYFYEKSDGIVLLSESFKKPFLRLVGEGQSDKLFAISNPFSYGQKENVGEYKKEKIVLFVSRLEYSPKRLDRILKAWGSIQHYDGWRLLIVGDGPSADFYKKMAAGYRLSNVEFLGQTNPESLYEKAQIICVSSTCEGFCLVLTEALQHGVIPIAFDSFESVHDIIVSGKNGFLVKPFQLKQYAGILKEVMVNDRLRQQMQQNIQADTSLRDSFNIEHITDNWENLLLSYKSRITWDS